jgi:hypothetical protein
MSDGSEGRNVADELRRIRDGVREEAPRAREAADVLPPARAAAGAPEITAPPRPEAAPDVHPPDNAAVNALWGLSSARGNVLFRLLRRILAPLVDAQIAFNSRQVQLDNEILEHVARRFDETHRHYDRVLGDYGRHVEDANERHLILQRELVAHVHDLVQRIDLVLAESERGRLSLESGLRDVRARLARLEERLAR